MGKRPELGTYVSRDVGAGQLYTEVRLSSVRCMVCKMRLVDVLAEAGETTHPACAGWPTASGARPVSSGQMKRLRSAVTRKR